MSHDKDYWSQRASTWNAESYQQVGYGNSLRLQTVMEMLSKRPIGTILDIGAGAGAAVDTYLRAGWDARGTDYALGMVAEGNAFLVSQGHPDGLMSVGDVSDLSPFADASLDVVTALGLVPFIEHDTPMFQEVSRVLKPGGSFIASFCNALFDLFTFNRYTRDFFAENFIDFATDNPAKRQALNEEVRGLITNPDAPQRHLGNSSRDNVFIRSENPLTVAKRLVPFGLVQHGMPYFYNLHLVPPLLEGGHPDLVERAHALEAEMRQDWRAMFACTQFVLEFRKIS